jgi:hypothetical protein
LALQCDDCKKVYCDACYHKAMKTTDEDLAESFDETNCICIKCAEKAGNNKEEENDEDASSE